jgi:hypothetical protein
MGVVESVCINAKATISVSHDVKATLHSFRPTIDSLCTATGVKRPSTTLGFYPSGEVEQAREKVINWIESSDMSADESLIDWMKANASIRQIGWVLVEARPMWKQNSEIVKIAETMLAWDRKKQLKDWYKNMAENKITHTGIFMTTSDLAARWFDTLKELENSWSVNRKELVDQARYVTKLSSFQALVEEQFLHLSKEKPGSSSSVRTKRASVKREFLNGVAFRGSLDEDIKNLEADLAANNSMDNSASTNWGKFSKKKVTLNVEPANDPVKRDTKKQDNALSLDDDAQEDMDLADLVDWNRADSFQTAKQSKVTLASIFGSNVS